MLSEVAWALCLLTVVCGHSLDMCVCRALGAKSTPRSARGITACTAQKRASSSFMTTACQSEVGGVPAAALQVRGCGV